MACKPAEVYIIPQLPVLWFQIPEETTIQDYCYAVSNDASRKKPVLC